MDKLIETGYSGWDFVPTIKACQRAIVKDMILEELPLIYTGNLDDFYHTVSEPGKSCPHGYVGLGGNYCCNKNPTTKCSQLKR